MTDTEGKHLFVFITSSSYNQIRTKHYFSYHSYFESILFCRYTITNDFLTFSAPAVEAQQPQKTAAAPVQKEIIGKYFNHLTSPHHVKTIIKLI